MDEKREQTLAMLNDDNHPPPPPRTRTNDNRAPVTKVEEQ